MSETTQKPSMGGFTWLWLGQIVSMFGTGLTGFALNVWVLQESGSITDYTLIMVFGSIPGLLLAPFAGALIDRWHRKWVMILSDSGAALGTLALIALLWGDHLQVWHIYVITGFAATFMSLQAPAFMAVVGMMVPKQQLGRAAGMMQFGHAASRILAPLAAGALLGIIAMKGVIAIDLVTFLFAVGITLMVAIPRLPTTSGGGGGTTIWQQARYGFDYILQRPSFISLTLFFAVLNLLFGFGFILVTPLVLSFASTTELGIVLSVSSAGMLAGSILMTVWGGPQRRMLGVLGFSPLLCLGFLITGWQPSIWLVSIGVFLIFVSVPVINSCSQAIWQVKVAPEVQGRVFATQRMISQLTVPISYLLAGLLADSVAGPLMAPGGALANSMGRLLGVGEGRGIGLLYVVMGALMLLTTLLGFLNPRLRNLEDVVPDADADAA